MKRISLYLLVLGLLCVFVTGCGNASSQATGEPIKAQSAPLQQAERAAQTPAEEPVSQAADLPANAKQETGVVDLTVLSSTMVYSEVYQMVMTPEDYYGKTVKMKGQFAVYEGNPQNMDGPAYYFAVLIADATACCQQGLEFVLEDDSTYPEDYPPDGTEITVTGTFETYEEDGYQYFHLTDSSMIVIES